MEGYKMKKELENLLLHQEEFLVEGMLNKNKLSELARKYDAKLLNVLMKEEKIKNHFFVEVEEGVLVFKKDVFLQFLNNKEFLPDSFTAYKTKIGLGSRNGNLLSESRDIVLNFPYKDCILEGGQTKEDAKRDEIFFNETLAPTEITRLLDDKVFTNFIRYDKDGEREVKEIKEDDNFIIKGNNLVVLYSLKKRYAGKVKCIYIDTTNKSGKDIINPMSAWFASFPEGAIQDNDKNKVNKLQVAMHPDKTLVRDQSATIKKDGTVSGAVAYELTDLTTPVKLTAYKGVGGVELGSQEFTVK